MPELSRFGAFLLLAVASLTIMVGCVIVPGLVDVATHLGVEGAAGWLVTVPSLGVVLFAPLAGRVIDRFGAYPALCGGLFAYGLLGVAGALSSGMVAVFADRFLLGGATAFVMAAGTGLLSEFYEGAARLKMIGRQGMAIELGGVIFLAVGGVLASVRWFYPFGLYLIAWVLLVLMLMAVPRPASRRGMLHTHVMVPTGERLRAVYGAALMSMILFFTAVIMLPLSLRAEGLDEAQTGYFLSFVSMVAVGGAAMMPWLAGRLGPWLALCVAFVCYALAHALFAIAQSVEWFAFAGVFMGLGFGFSIPLVNHMTVERSDIALRGRNLSYLSMAIFLGQFLASFMESLPGDRPAVYMIAAVLGAVIALVMGVLGARAGRSRLA
jgi:MFS family permease